MNLHLAGLALLLPLAALAGVEPVELHHVLELSAPEDKTVALTLDACDGGYDAELLQNLIRLRVPATVFVTGKWLRRHGDAVAVLNAHADLFDLEDHGDRHVVAIIGPGRTVYGIAGHPDAAHLKREVLRGAEAVEMATGRRPQWYRGAAGEYDAQALQVIDRMGFRVAGFSVNADDGAKLTRSQVVRRLLRVKSGDIIIAHLNKADSDTAEGLAVGIEQLLGKGFRFVTLRDANVRLVPEVKPLRAQKRAVEKDFPI
jgi:peptidoglycan/xylan/chitin deacetylase (PgdA/CDA1 family)